jgi:hypothetical protein
MMNLPEVCNRKNLTGNRRDEELALEPGCVRVLRLEANYWSEVRVMVFVQRTTSEELVVIFHQYALKH